MSETFWNRSFESSLPPNLKSKTCPEPSRRIQNRKLVATVALVVTFTMCGAMAHAQQPVTVPRVVYLSVGTASSMERRVDSFRRGLRDLGYVEGKNVVVESRFSDGKADRLSALVTEILQRKVDVIVSAGPSVTRPVKEATSTIPIVMTQDSDPVGNGFVSSLAHPGGNVTGLSSVDTDLSGKRLDLLREIIPRMSRVAVFGTSTNPGNKQSLGEIERGAKAVGMKLQYFDVLSSNDIEKAFRAASKARAEAVIYNVLGPIDSANRPEVMTLATKNRLPVIYELPSYVLAGGLMSYGVNLADLDRRAAIYVDKILKGAKPAELPVEQPKKFEFIVNLKAAKQIGLTVPPNVLARADRVIR
jgi:putative tryptophan/tyrosine transport system substrate-binding protein